MDEQLPGFMLGALGTLFWVISAVVLSAWVLLPFLVIGVSRRLDRIGAVLDTIADGQDELLRRTGSASDTDAARSRTRFSRPISGDADGGYGDGA